jgi:hypothetical protein
MLAQNNHGTVLPDALTRSTKNFVTDFFDDGGWKHDYSYSKRSQKTIPFRNTYFG